MLHTFSSRNYDMAECEFWWYAWNRTENTQFFLSDHRYVRVRKECGSQYSCQAHPDISDFQEFVWSTRMLYMYVLIVRLEVIEKKIGEWKNAVEGFFWYIAAGVYGGVNAVFFSASLTVSRKSRLASGTLLPIGLRLRLKSRRSPCLAVAAGEMKYQELLEWILENEA